MSVTSFLIPLSTAICVFLLTYTAADWVWDRRDPAKREIELLADEIRGDQSSRLWIWARLSPLGEWLLPILGQERSRVAESLYIAGYRRPTAPAVFMVVKATIVLAAAITVWLLWWLPSEVTNAQLFMLSTVTGAGAILLPDFWLRKAAARRQTRLRNAFPDALDMIVICVEAGLGLSAAMERVTDELRYMHKDLATELAAVNAEIRSGIDRATALRSLNVRTGLPEIKGFVSLLIQTLQLGTGVADSLRIYADEFRDQRMQKAEERAAKTGTKMIFPLVFCEFPAFFLIAIGPATLRLIDAFPT